MSPVVPDRGALCSLRPLCFLHTLPGSRAQCSERLQFSFHRFLPCIIHPTCSSVLPLSPSSLAPELFTKSGGKENSVRTHTRTHTHIHTHTHTHLLSHTQYTGTPPAGESGYNSQAWLVGSGLVVVRTV